jgi:hypothetical protein
VQLAREQDRYFLDCGGGRLLLLLRVSEISKPEKAERQRCKQRQQACELARLHIRAPLARYPKHPNSSRCTLFFVV